jgi:hypothetical protein
VEERGQVGPWHDRDVKSPAGEDGGSRVALFGVDAFTDRPFSGNPAMVCSTRGEWIGAPRLTWLPSPDHA